MVKLFRIADGTCCQKRSSDKRALAAVLHEDHVLGQGQILLDFPVRVNELDCLKHPHGVLVMGDCHGAGPVFVVPDALPYGDINSYIKCFFQ